MRRATVTVLFTDLVASTALTAGLDRDEADRVRQRHFAVLRQPLAIHEGTEVKNLGDGLMVMSSRSVRSGGCGGDAAGDRASQPVDGRTARGVRIGMSLGEAIEEDDDYFGDPVVEAARLCAAAGAARSWPRTCAGPGGTPDAPSLRRGLGLELKGLPEPVETVEVAWEPV